MARFQDKGIKSTIEEFKKKLSIDQFRCPGEKFQIADLPLVSSLVSHGPFG